jgi:hypothetical protein
LLVIQYEFNSPKPAQRCAIHTEEINFGHVTVEFELQFQNKLKA